MKWGYINLNTTKNKSFIKLKTCASVFFGTINNIIQLLTVEMLMTCGDCKSLIIIFINTI